MPISGPASSIYWREELANLGKVDDKKAIDRKRDMRAKQAVIDQLKCDRAEHEFMIHRANVLIERDTPILCIVKSVLEATEDSKESKLLSSVKFTKGLYYQPATWGRVQTYEQAVLVLSRRNQDPYHDPGWFLRRFFVSPDVAPHFQRIQKFTKDEFLGLANSFSQEDFLAEDIGAFLRYCTFVGDLFTLSGSFVAAYKHGWELIDEMPIDDTPRAVQFVKPPGLDDMFSWMVRNQQKINLVRADRNTTEAQILYKIRMNYPRGISFRLEKLQGTLGWFDKSGQLYRYTDKQNRNKETIIRRIDNGWGPMDIHQEYDPIFDPNKPEPYFQSIHSIIEREDVQKSLREAHRAGPVDTEWELYNVLKPYLQVKRLSALAGAIMTRHRFHLYLRWCDQIGHGIWQQSTSRITITMASNSPPPRPPILFTPFALKYGITPTRAHFNAMLNPAYPLLQKSLYTPILPLHPAANVGDRDRAEKTLNLQRYRLKGLTTLTLIENEFVSERRMRMASLSNPVHPFFARRRWKSVLPGQIQYPLVDGNGVSKGVWDLEKDDLAWEIMLPSIRLASMVLSHLHTHPWLDTLLLGKEEPLDPNRFPAPTLVQQTISTPQLHNVMKIRGPGPNNAKECAAAFDDLQRWPTLRDLVFGMVSCDKGPTGEKNHNGRLVNGFATWLVSDFGNAAAIFIAYERVALLLRNDLTDSDRLCVQLLTANTLVHEAMHSIGITKRHRDQVRAGGEDAYPIQHEPFLEDESLGKVVSELGCSMDDAVWGGALHGIAETLDPEVVPLGYGVLKGPQPMLSSYPALISPPLPKLDVFRPIQVEYYEGVQQTDFWDFNVRNFSHFRPGQILRGGSLTNLISTKNRDSPTPWQVVQNKPDYVAAIAPPNRATFILSRILLMTAADRVSYANAKRQKEMHENYVNLMQLRIKQTEAIWDQVEMLTRGDIEKGGYSIAQGLGRLLGAIEEVLGTVTNMLTSLSQFDRSSDAYTSGKADAQSFNRGLRHLLKDIAIASGGPTLGQKANTLSHIVEKTRVLLTVSPTLPNGISLEDDMILAQQDETDCVQRIEDARVLLEAGDHPTANTMCEEVSKTMSSSLLTKCAARILMCHSDRKDYAIRLNVVSRTIETLEKAPAPEGRDVEQKRVLDLALKLRARLTTGDQAQRGSGIFIV
ncbi:hypothetical protein BKA65DRAFT_562268 [Rhexocercosporidium sp. MPI-PUGE-AT-0058]|nr:hypothetical protein BKA65DRAFT_562268 [Rhexocercosporidium sp. MPI-PUGE-AT-0058]